MKWKINILCFEKYFWIIREELGLHFTGFTEDKTWTDEPIAMCWEPRDGGKPNHAPADSRHSRHNFILLNPLQ